MKAKALVFILFLIGILAPAAARAQYTSVCMRNTEKIQKIMTASNEKDPGYMTSEFREMKVLAAQVIQPCAEANASAKRLFEQTIRAIEKYDADCRNPSLSYQDEDCRPMAQSRFKHEKPAMFGGGIYYNPQYTTEQVESAARWMALFKSEVAKALSDPNYSADLGPIKGEGSPTAPRTASAPASPPDDPSCPGDNLDQANGEIATIEDALAQYNKQVSADSMAATPALQAVLWGTSQEMAIIKKYCHNAAFTSKLASLDAAYQSALHACRQINSSPDTECVPVLPDSAASESRMAQIPVPKGSSVPGDTSASPGVSADAASSPSGVTGSAAAKQSGTTTQAGSSTQQATAKPAKQHGPQNASSCIVVKNSRLTNACDYDVEVSFCVENPQQTKSFFDNSKAFECPNGGLSTVPAGNAEPNVLHGDLQWFACAEVDVATMRTQYNKGSGYGGSCY